MVENNNPTGQEFPEWTDRTVQLLGKEKCRILQGSHVFVAGMGGVGSMAAENLVRAGVGSMTIVDNDTVQLSNINRQVPALHSTIGKQKVEVMSQRLREINPGLKLHAIHSYINEDTIHDLLNESYDFIVDAIDTLSPKILLIREVFRRNLPLASSMGSGGKTDPTKITITDFGKTYNCRLAYLLRKKLRKDGIHGGFKVVFSSELVDKNSVFVTDNERNKKSIVGTVPYIPIIFGSMLASIVVDGLTKSRAAADC
jgi:tRNA A37 threonylcarbamoyladenosine dehydratase